MDINQKDDKPGLHWIKSPDGVCEVYANMMHVTWTLDDVRIRLGQLIGSPETPDPGPTFRGAAEERAAITLSWRVAKILRDQLSGVVEKFEQANSPIDINIKLPPSVD